MTPAQITAAIERIRATEHRDDVQDARPATEPWVETPPFAAMPSSEHARGHVEVEATEEPGIYCQDCLYDKPETGGWDFGCEKGQLRRSFKGDGG